MQLPSSNAIKNGKGATITFAGPMCNFVTYVLSSHTQKKTGSSSAFPVLLIFKPDADN
jgi:hypothetical protein